MNFSKYTIKNAKEVLDDLATNEGGLSVTETEKRLKIHGFNEVRGREFNSLNIFLRQFKSPFFFLLFIATLVAFFVGEKIDALVILAFIFINVLLGFFQEARAEKAVSLLKKFIPSNIKVLRDGKEKIIDKRFLVPGDIVLLEAGDIIPADLRILKIENFVIDESVLTGESAPIPKIADALSKEVKEVFEAKNIAFAGTSVISGEAKGVVIGTGKGAVFGEITKLISGISKESVYEKELFKFSRLILKMVVVSIVFIFLANLIIRGTTNFFEFLLFSIALIVSIIPEALPLVVTFSLSRGALKLAKKKVVVKRLSAVEDLGDIEILCSDKTGTLTENKLRLEGVFAADKEKCFLYGLLSSAYMEDDAQSVSNPFDIAIFDGAPEKTRQAIKKFKEISEASFDPLRLRNSVLVEDENKNLILIVRGAPETILKLSSKTEGNLEIPKIKEETEKEGRTGKRILAVAYKTFTKSSFCEEDERDLRFLGYFSFSDPLKESTKQAIHLSKKAGLKIKIITGDAKEVAGQIAVEIGLIKDENKVILGEEIDYLPSDDFDKACEEFSVFARISPQTKYRIVSALQKKYEVGFLGEGINDAPALNVANLAIVVDGAADISHEVSDIVLLEKDLKVIVDGILQGRNIFSNINKYIKCTLASNFGNFYSIALISLAIPFLPMLPIQILLVNLLSDFPLISVASDRVDVEELRKPKYYQLSRVIFLIIFLAVVSTIFDFIFFGLFHKVEAPLLQTLWFIESILTEIALIFSIRTSHFFLKTKAPSVPLVIISIFTVLATVFLPFTNFGKEFFHFVLPPIPSLLTVFGLVISYFFVSEAVKLLYLWKRNQNLNNPKNKSHSFG